ncbi:MAG: hypothetical protein PHV74_15530, partial [Dehalococcoidia bacterium]|nr:hypothetical protein [Dehalococcoidia bacterium]
MPYSRFDSTVFKQTLSDHLEYCCDSEVLCEVIKVLEGLIARSNSEEVNWREFKSFWPPRIVQAYQNNHVATFFGAGLSFGAGLPGWNDLLLQLGADGALVGDPDLSHDPLTLAELAAE